MYAYMYIQGHVTLVCLVCETVLYSLGYILKYETVFQHFCFRTCNLVFSSTHHQRFPSEYTLRTVMMVDGVCIVVHLEHELSCLSCLK